MKNGEITEVNSRIEVSLMTITRKLNDIQNITLEEVMEFYKVSGWCFKIANGKIGSITIKKSQCNGPN
jgi:hypothetical protein